MSSYVFSPSVGGIETVSALLAPEFVKAGHEVILITRTAANDNVSRPFPVERNPSRRRLLELVRWCDVYFQNNISLALSWPLLLARKPWIIAHQTWFSESADQPNWKASLKKFVLKHGSNAAISRAVAAGLPLPSKLIGNPYSADRFQLQPGIPRERELVFLGRLVPDKGVDLLIEALALLRARGLHPRLTIIGSGSEQDALCRLAKERHVRDQIEFLGSQPPEKIVPLLNAHQILVVPSRWAEPFGVVVLEGIACGCAIVASSGGGLPEAMGPCGLTFQSGDAQDLADALRQLLTDPDLRVRLLKNAAHHLRQFEPATVASQYLALFDQARRNQPNQPPCR